jgi:hypothetical protein
MKNGFSLFVLALIFGLTITSCESSSVRRVDPNTQTDLSGYWNDTDVRIVCNTLIDDCLDSLQNSDAVAKKGPRPVIAVGSFRNQSDEHIDTSIISKRMEMAILNSGRASFVASGSHRDEIRTEREEQQSWASEESAKALANETGADFYLTGSVKAIEDQAGNQATRTYFVYAELTDIESNQVIWIGENDEIKKIITNAPTKFGL